MAKAPRDGCRDAADTCASRPPRARCGGGEGEVTPPPRPGRSGLSPLKPAHTQTLPGLFFPHRSVVPSYNYHCFHNQAPYVGYLLCAKLIVSYSCTFLQ